MLPHKAPKQLNHSQLHKYNAGWQSQWKWQTKGKAADKQTDKLPGYRRATTAPPLATSVQNDNTARWKKGMNEREGGKGDNKQLGAPQSRGLLSYFTLPWTAAVTEREERRNQCIILAAQQQKQKAEKKICIHCALCSKPRQKTKKATTQRAVRTCVGLGHMQALPIFGLPRGCNVDNVVDNDDNNNSMRKESSSWLAAQNRIRIYKPCRPLFLAFLGSPIIECLNVIAL